jgi:hypothetical protein
MNHREITLRGGTHDGEVISFDGRRLIYMKKRISMEEGESLKINEKMSYAWPEEVYYQTADDKAVFTYDRTVNYHIAPEVKP